MSYSCFGNSLVFPNESGSWLCCLVDLGYDCYTVVEGEPAVVSFFSLDKSSIISC